MTLRRRRDRQTSPTAGAQRPRWPAARRGLPGPGERVAVVGCGTSWFMAMAYAGAARTRRPGRDRRVPGLRVPARPALRPGRRDHPLRHHHRGRSTCCDGRRPRRPPCSPPTRRAGRRRWPAHAVALPFADERSVVQTRFATSALALLRARLGEDLGRRGRRRRGGRRGRRCRCDPADIEQVTFLGRGWTIGPGGRGRAEVPRGGDVLDRGVPGDGLPARPDLDRRARPGGLGVRRGARRAGRRGGGDRRRLRARRHARPDGRPESLGPARSPVAAAAPPRASTRTRPAT